jgi:hypothetical protein
LQPQNRFTTVAPLQSNFTREAYLLWTDFGDSAPMTVSAPLQHRQTHHSPACVSFARIIVFVELGPLCVLHSAFVTLPTSAIQSSGIWNDGQRVLSRDTSN